MLAADLALHRVHAGETQEQGLPIGLRELRSPGRTRENLAAESQRLLPVTVGQQAVVADPHETVRQDVEEKPAEKLLAGQRHLSEELAPRIVFPGEGHPLVVEASQALIGDRYAVGVARQIGEHLLRAAKRRLAVDHPSFTVQHVEGRQVGGGQLSALGRRLDRREDFASKELSQDSYRKKEIRSAPDPPVTVDRESAARHDAVQVGMQGQLLAPGMEDGQDADASAQVLGVGRKLQ